MAIIAIAIFKKEVRHMKENERNGRGGKLPLTHKFLIREEKLRNHHTPLRILAFVECFVSKRNNSS